MYGIIRKKIELKIKSSENQYNIYLILHQILLVYFQKTNYF